MRGMRRPPASAEPEDAPALEAAPTAESPREAPTGLDRLRRYTWWTSAGLVYGMGAAFVVLIFVTEPALPLAVVAGVGTACGSVASARLVNRRLVAIAGRGAAGDDEVPVHLLATAISGAVVVVVAAQWATGGPAAWGIIPGLVVGGIAVSVPRRLRVVVVLGGALAATAVAIAARYVATGEVDLPGTAVGTAVVAWLGAGLVFGVWSWEVVDRLDRARRLEGELAVADERLRFAADLHNIQGHHLQVIALESELATRLAEADPSAAGAHMLEAHEHARAALDDTRAVVQGYRRVSLGAELANGARVLAAAGIDGRLDNGVESAADDVPEPARHLLGLVVREATTNVLRHSRADQARLALEVDAETARLQMHNNGAGANGAAPGTGLATLAERLWAAGGALDWGREGEWFTVIARVPLAGERSAR